MATFRHVEWLQQEREAKCLTFRGKCWIFVKLINVDMYQIMFHNAYIVSYSFKFYVLLGKNNNDNNNFGMIWIGLCGNWDNPLFL